MEIGINISNKTHYTEQVKYFKKFGVTRTFVNANHKELDGVMQCLKENGIICDTLHAPYICPDMNINDIWHEGEKGEQMLQVLLDSVSLCEKYSVPALIVHVSSGRNMPEITPIGDIRYGKLVDFAKEKGVTVAFENLTFFENLDHVLKTFPESGFCYDCGHEACRMTGVRYMHIFGERAVALHIHDNRCELDTDDHFIPFDGRIDFENVAQDIARSGFRGTLMLELKCKKDEKYKNVPDEEYFEKASNAAKKLARMVEEYRN